MSNTFELPGYRINEYRLIVPLSDALQERVQQLRKNLHERHGVKFPFELKPSLTILRCHAFEKVEPRFIERMQHVAMGCNPFKVELKDFSAYPSHTIYIDVPTKSPFNELAKSLRKAKWLMNIPEHEPHFIPEPHLIIAQRLKPMQFINMWLECEHSQFTGKFIADSLILLRRSNISKRYEVVRKMDMLNLPMEVKQGDLFS
jgi:2'-5' RNA ligase